MGILSKITINNPIKLYKMSLEFKLMNDLEPVQKEEIAEIARDNEAPYWVQDEISLLLDPDIPLYRGADMRVEVGILEDGNLLGFYDVPFFGIVDGALQNTLPGYIAIRKTDHDRGIGTLAIGALKGIFHELAYLQDVDLVHTGGSVNETTRFTQNGYEFIGMGQTGEWQQQHLYQKTFAIEKQSLSIQNQRIVTVLYNRIMNFLDTPQNPGPN